MTDAVVAEAVARWDAATRAIPDLDAWVESALQGQRESGQVAKSGPRCTVARAHLMSADGVAADQRVLDAVARALVAAGSLLLDDDALGLRYLGADWTTAPSAHLLRLDPHYPEQIVIGRFDGVAGDSGLTVFEFNGGMPGGMADTDAASRMMQAWPGYGAVAAEHDVRSFDLVDAAMAAAISTWHGFGGTGLPFMVLAMPDELQATAGAHLPGYLAGAERAGVELVIVDPGELVREGGRLLLRGRPVDLIMRGFYTSMFDYLGDRITPLLDAVAAGEVPMVTSLRAGVFGHKALFAVMTDETVDLGLTGPERATVQAHVPWTRLATPGRTTDPGGERVALEDYVVTARTELVLKPAIGFGGAGVVLGWESEPQQWAAAWESAVAAGGHIVQRRVPMGTVTYPALQPGLPDVRYVSDHNPVVANRRIVGYFTRLATSGGITNMTTGDGSLTPSFVLQ